MQDKATKNQGLYFYQSPLVEVNLASWPSHNARPSHQLQSSEAPSAEANAGRAAGEGASSER